MKWGIYNQYVWLITSDVTTYELIKSSVDQSSGDVHWLLYTTVKNNLGSFIGLWKQPIGMFIDSYTSKFDTETGQYVFDTSAIEQIITTFEGSISNQYLVEASQPSVYQSETPSSTVAAPDEVVHTDGSGI
jgi:hypothetical protein